MMNLASATNSAAAERPARRAVHTVLVLHSSAIVAAGLVAALRRLPECEVRVPNETDGGCRASASLAGVDVVMTDAEWLARKSKMELSDLRACVNGPPKFVLVTTQGTAGAPPAGVSACLSLQSAEDDVLHAVRKLTGDTGAATASVAPARATSALPHAPPRGGLPPGALRRVMEHVEQRLAEKIELADLASLARLSECHFSRAFKQSLGLPPHRYLMMRRIVAAADLIKTTDRPLTEISLEVGFSDQSHFTRVFGDITGETPRSYRRRHR